jgi:hypothetical protein
MVPLAILDMKIGSSAMMSLILADPAPEPRIVIAVLRSDAAGTSARGPADSPISM